MDLGHTDLSLAPENAAVAGAHFAFPTVWLGAVRAWLRYRERSPKPVPGTSLGKSLRGTRARSLVPKFPRVASMIVFWLSLAHICALRVSAGIGKSLRPVIPLPAHMSHTGHY